MIEIDRYALAMTARWQRSIADDYERFEFHPAMARMQTFCSEDLGAFYLDILKDRLYTTAAGSRERRSAQTALWHITHSLVRRMAPILSFTAEEAWPLLAPQMHAQGAETIFTQVWHEIPEVEDAQVLLDRWERLRTIRAEVLRELEAVRSAGGIGSSLQAELELHLTATDFDLVDTLGDDLRFVMITSQARIVRVDDAGEAGVVVHPTRAMKCERCWHWRSDVGQDPARPGLCGRCVSNLFGSGEPRRFA